MTDRTLNILLRYIVHTVVTELYTELFSAWPSITSNLHIIAIKASSNKIIIQIKLVELPMILYCVELQLS
jgi:hypothetical protein